jgi:uncharacterized protein
VTVGTAPKVVDSAALEALAIGAGILGTGGGGNPYLGKIALQRMFGADGSVPIVAVEDLPDDAFVLSTGGMGSPTIGIERLAEGMESLRAAQALEKYCGRAATHIIPGEIGGSNSIQPVKVAFQMGLPVVDGDAMGRAFPELQMDTFTIYGIPPTPAALSDIRGHAVIFDDLADANDLERYARAVTIQMGGAAGYAFPLMSAADVRRTAIAGTLTLAIRLGEAVIDARREHRDPVAAATDEMGGRLLFTGKITDVDRRLVGGFARGALTMDGTGDDAGRTLDIRFQNENLVARDDQGTVICAVPDLICIVDVESGEPITTEVLRYGLRVAVIGIPAPEMLKTELALRYVGPAAFGYPDVEYIPMPGTYGVRA